MFSKLNKKRKVAYVIVSIINILCALVLVGSFVLIFMRKIPAELGFMTVMFMLPIMMGEGEKESIIEEQEREDDYEVWKRVMKERGY